MLSMISMNFSIMCLFLLLSSEQIMVMYLFMGLFILSYMINNQEFITIFFKVDILSNTLILLTVWLSFLMILASFKNYIFKDKSFLFYVNLMMFLLVICFSVSNLLMFYLFFESVLFPIILLIFGWGTQPERIQAGFYMLMYTLVGSVPMLIMIMIFKKNSLMYFYMDWQNYIMGFFFLVLMMGFMVKIPVFFFHLWLPKAHVEAPISGSMILAGILLKLGIYGIFRFKCFFLTELAYWSHFLMIASIWGGVIISIVCLFQIDIKSLIAYSSVCHMSIVFSGCMNLMYYSSFGSILLMLGHGLCSSGLFCLANMLYERFFTRSMILIKGMIKIFPSLSLWWFLFCMVNMSAPLTMNLFGEFFLILSILKISMMFILPLMMMIFLSACYSVFMFSYLNHGEGWMVWSSNLISSREYFLLFLHFFPLFIWLMKMDFFFKWI
uniref:NADH dehydrogenase subunit 4 n=1 Tax=Amblyomma papuanum TaxID=3065601 RepID=UPI0030FEE2A2